MFILLIIQKQLNSLLCHIVLVTDVWLPLRHLMADINHPMIKVSVDLRVCICNRCLHTQSDKKILHGSRISVNHLASLWFLQSDSVVILWQPGFFKRVFTKLPNVSLYHLYQIIPLIENKCIKIYRGTVLKEQEKVVSLTIWQIYPHTLEELQDLFYHFAKSDIHTCNNSLFSLSPQHWTRSSYKLNYNGSQESLTTIKTEPSPGPELYNSIVNSAELRKPLVQLQSSQLVQVVQELVQPRKHSLKSCWLAMAAIFWREEYFNIAFITRWCQLVSLWLENELRHCLFYYYKNNIKLYKITI